MVVASSDGDEKNANTDLESKLNEAFTKLEENLPKV